MADDPKYLDARRVHSGVQKVPRRKAGSTPVARAQLTARAQLMDAWFSAYRGTHEESGEVDSPPAAASPGCEQGHAHQSSQSQTLPASVLSKANGSGGAEVGTKASNGSARVAVPTGLRSLGSSAGFSSDGFSSDGFGGSGKARDKQGSFAMSFRDKLKANAKDRQKKRHAQLKRLATITNSKAFKEELVEITTNGGEREHRALSALYDLLDEEMSVDLAELRFIKRLGEGGFAFVDLYEKTVTGTGEIVRYAVKVMKDKQLLPPLEMYGEPRFAKVPEADRVQFLAEAVLLKALQHKNVVGCYGCVREDGLLRPGDGVDRPAPKLLQEYCPGGTLLDQIRKPRYSAHQALVWLRDVAAGMDYLHLSGGMHRDLKPENIMIKDGVAKVADFGLFRLDTTNPMWGDDDSKRDDDSKDGGDVRSLSPFFNGAAGDESVHSSKESGSFNKDRAKKLASRVSKIWMSKDKSPMRDINASGSGHFGKLFTPATFNGAGASRKSFFGTVTISPNSKSSYMKRRWSVHLKDLEQSTKGFTTKTGTERYMAPELHTFEDNAVYTNKVDVFSFAILAYELLARRRAYEDLYMTMEQVARLVCEQGLRPKVPKKWSPDLVALMERMWAKDPNDRPSFGDIVDDLNNFLSDAEDPKGEGETFGGDKGSVEALLGLSSPPAAACCAVM